MEIYATELMGAEAYDAQGNFVGRVREFFHRTFASHQQALAFPSFSRQSSSR